MRHDESYQLHPLGNIFPVSLNIGRQEHEAAEMGIGNL